MSKKQPNKEIKASVDTNDNNVEDVQEEELTWDELKEMRDDVAKTIIGQQVQVHELAKAHADILEKDQDTLDTVKGLMESLNDIAEELQETSLKHAKVTTGNKVVEFKKGNVERGDDEELTYIRIAGEYITITEKVSTLASTAYLDIFTKLKVDDTTTKNLVEAVAEGVSDVAKAKQSMAKGETDAE